MINISPYNINLNKNCYNIMEKHEINIFTLPIIRNTVDLKNMINLYKNISLLQYISHNVEILSYISMLCYFHLSAFACDKMIKIINSENKRKLKKYIIFLINIVRNDVKLRREFTGSFGCQKLLDEYKLGIQVQNCLSLCVCFVDGQPTKFSHSFSKVVVLEVC
ncbi:hypothetical protein TCON_1224 [Astathelohania contejeani]|uniref:Uncharacterized protein n=1 Tax=Astathelohania contejeani TaxID=164912 RepID=A0ABQ7HZJ4_9MICR|nr:hypothetical protein TCON_1224 [Thelohania contejeani]